MRNPWRKIPEIAHSYIVHNVVSVLVHGSDTHPSIKHVRPFGLFVQFSSRTSPGPKTHINPCEGFGNRQLPLRYLASPASLFKAVACVTEGELQIRDGAVIGVRGGVSTSGFWRSRSRLRGLGSSAPSPFLSGCGVRVKNELLVPCGAPVIFALRGAHWGKSCIRIPRASWLGPRSRGR